MCESDSHSSSFFNLFKSFRTKFAKYLGLILTQFTIGFMLKLILGQCKSGVFDVTCRGARLKFHRVRAASLLPKFRTINTLSHGNKKDVLQTATLHLRNN